MSDRPHRDENLERDLDRWNAPQAWREYARKMRERDSGPFKVFPANWTAVRWWLAAQTQIRAVDGGVIGYDYTAADLARRLAGLPEPDAWDFAAFQILEAESTRIYNQQREEARNG